MKAIEKESEYAFDSEKLTSYYDCQSHDTSRAEKFRYNVVDVRCNSRDVIFRKKHERESKESEHAFDSVSHMTHQRAENRSLCSWLAWNKFQKFVTCIKMSCITNYEVTVFTVDQMSALEKIHTILQSTTFWLKWIWNVII